MDAKETMSQTGGSLLNAYNEFAPTEKISDGHVERFHVFGNTILIKLDKVATETASGIVISTEASHVPTSSTGIVASVGRGKYTRDNVRVACSLKPGDRVIYPIEGVDGSYVSTRKKLTLNGSDFILISEDDIYGVIEDE